MRSLKRAPPCACCRAALIVAADLARSASCTLELRTVGGWGVVGVCVWGGVVGMQPGVAANVAASPPARLPARRPRRPLLRSQRLVLCQWGSKPRRLPSPPPPGQLPTPPAHPRSRRAPQQAQRLGAVLVLRPLALARDDDARRHVRHPHRRVGRVDVLPARAARAEGVPLQVRLCDADVRLGPAVGMCRAVGGRRARGGEG